MENHTFFNEEQNKSVVTLVSPIKLSSSACEDEVTVVTIY